jgi:hypothetical protein
VIGQWGWALCVCLGFLGWGAGLVRVTGLARLPGVPRDPGAAACLGVAFAVCCGGLVDLLRIMSPALVIGFVSIGILLAAVQYLPAIGLPRLPTGLVARLLLVAVLLLGAIAVFGHVYYPDFSRFDDYPGYLVFPEKLMASGSLGFEPFSERRLLTSLGGMYFLQALVLAGADFYFFHLIDPALGVGLIVLMLEAAMRRRSVALAWRLGVLLFVLLLLPTIVNLTAIVLPVALMLLAYLVLEADPEAEPGPRSLGRIVALSLVAAALVAIKPAYLTWPGSFLALAYGRRLVLDRFRLRSWYEPAALAAMTVVLLLPWMFANLHETGTAMYPVFGNGYYASRYGNYPPVWTLVPPAEQFRILLHESWTLGPRLLASGLFFVLALRASTRSADRGAAGRPGAAMLTLYFLLACLVMLTTIAAGTAMQDLMRYGYPGMAAMLAVAFYYMAVAGSRVTRGEAAAAVAACLVVVAGNVHGVVQYYGHAVANLGMAVLGPGFRPAMLVGVLTHDDGAERQAVLRMQQAIPAGAPVLERLDYPFVLDFHRNDVLVADWPGVVSPPPGMPMFQGPEKLAAYLLGVSVRYVAYAYANESKFPASEASQLPDEIWILRDAKLAFDFQDNLAALMQTRRLVFKDDTRAVIDLAEPAK